LTKPERKKMKKMLACLAGAAALLPGAASAVQYQDTAVFDFTAASSSYTALFSWEDFLGSKGKSHLEADGKYSIVLTNAGNAVIASFNNIANGITGDTGGVFSGSFLKTFSGLTSGAGYELTFVGKWNAASGYTTNQSPSVSISAVPEPETYAMLLAGLGLIGTIARRRTSARH
jgi:hypothetical protein